MAKAPKLILGAKVQIVAPDTALDGMVGYVQDYYYGMGGLMPPIDEYGRTRKTRRHKKVRLGAFVRFPNTTLGWQRVPLENLKVLQSEFTANENVWKDDDTEYSRE